MAQVEHDLLQGATLGSVGDAQLGCGADGAADDLGDGGAEI